MTKDYSQFCFAFDRVLIYPAWENDLALKADSLERQRGFIFAYYRATFLSGENMTIRYPQDASGLGMMVENWKMKENL